MFPISPVAYHLWTLFLTALHSTVFCRLHFSLLSCSHPLPLPLEKHQTQVWLLCFTSLFREFTKRIGGSKHFYYWTANERYREWEDELPSFNESPEVPDDVDPTEAEQMRLNRWENSSIFTAGRSFLPARNQTTIRQRLHRPEGHLLPNV